MLLYKRYLLKKIVGYFFIIATILICLIWFTKVISFIKYITEKGISVFSFFHLFFLVLPSLTLLIIPISLFIAIIASYSSMKSHNEITILRNSGLNKIAIVKPAIFVSIILSLICFLITLYLMPMANKNLKTTLNSFGSDYANIMISPGIFESLNNLTIYVDGRDANNKLSGILLYENYNEENSVTMTAKEGDLIEEDGSILIHLRNGTLQKYNFAQRSSDILYFDEYVVNLSKNDTGNLPYIWRPSERTIYELLYPDRTQYEGDIELAVKMDNSFRVELHQRFTNPLFSIVLALIACAYALRGEFSRRASIKNNVYSIITASSFIAINMVSYNLMEKSRAYNILLYGNILFFTAFPIYMLQTNFTKPK